jgi:hypothetical protein
VTKVRDGDRVKMTGTMRDDPNPLKVGDQGTVRAVLNEGTPHEQIVVAWDSGRSLLLLPRDPFKVIAT